MVPLHVPIVPIACVAGVPTSCKRLLRRLSCPWLPFLIGQVCSQVWCRPYFGANFGFFELQIRTFPWPPGIVEVGTFYPLTFKVISKYPNILRESSSLKLTIMVLVLSRKETKQHVIFSSNCGVRHFAQRHERYIHIYSFFI